MITSQQYQYIIWDWNGTLLNDVWLCVEVVNDLLKSHPGDHLDEISYREIFDFPIIEYYRKAGFDFNVESFELLCDKFIGNYKNRVRECQLHEGTLDVLNYFNQLGTQQLVLSAAEQTLLDQMIDNFETRSFFLQSSGLNNNLASSKVGNGIKLMEKQNIDPSKAIFVGDTLHDYEVAQKIGIDCVLIAQGHHSYQKLKSANIAVLNTMEELKQLLT